MSHFTKLKTDNKIQLWLVDIAYTMCIVGIKTLTTIVIQVQHAIVQADSHVYHTRTLNKLHAGPIVLFVFCFVSSSLITVFKALMSFKVHLSIFFSPRFKNIIAAIQYWIIRKMNAMMWTFLITFLKVRPN